MIAALCAGVHGSASTWVFNIVRDLLTHHHPKLDFTSLHINEFDNESERVLTEKALILKSHIPGPALRAMARLFGVPVLVSIRDPRDSVASLIQRFGISFEQALMGVSGSTEALCLLCSYCKPLVLRFEDGFTTDFSAIGQVAQKLQLPIDAALHEDIFKKFSSESVNTMLAMMDQQGAFGPPDRLRYDPETHWHPNHIGDGKIGKYTEALSPAQSIQVIYSTREFQSRFGYYVPPVAVQAPCSIAFGSSGTGAQFISSGFSRIEDWGIWSEGNHSKLVIPVARHRPEATVLEFHLRLASSFVRSGEMARARISIQGTSVASFETEPYGPATVRLVTLLPKGFSDRLEVYVDADGLRSPAELGESGDTRALGIGFERLILRDH